LTDRKRVDRAALEAPEADRLDGVPGIVNVAMAGLAEAAEARPAAEQNGVEHGDREAAVDLGLLRQVGDAARGALDASLDARRQAEQRLEERALARPVWSDDGRHLGGRDLGREVVDRGMAVVAHGQVDQLEGGLHSAHQTQSHNTAATASAPATRRGAPMARRAVPGEIRSCMAFCYNIASTESTRASVAARGRGARRRFLTVC